MASPQLQMAKDAMKAMMESGATTPQELRVVFEKFASGTPMPPDIPILPSRSFCRTSSRNASTWLLITEGVSTSINR